jgi:hypothetical protein
VVVVVDALGDDENNALRVRGFKYSETLVVFKTLLAGNRYRVTDTNADPS